MNSFKLTAASAQRLALVWRLTRTEWSDRYAGSALGVAWAFLWPLLQLAIFLTVFASIMGARLAGLEQQLGRFSYSVYLVAGMIPWLLFANGMQRICGVFLDKRDMLSKIAMPLAIMPMPVLLAESLVAAVMLFFFLLFLAFLGQLSLQSLWILPLVAGLMLLVYGLGLILAILSVFLSDAREAVQVVMQLGFWLTPVVYVPDILPAWVQPWLLANPAFWAVDGFQRALAFSQPPSPLNLVLLWSAAILATLTALWLLRRTERALRDVL